MDVTDKISKSFCIMPWVGIATTPSGGVRPCCWMDNTENYRGDISLYESSDYLKKVKDKFLNGEYPKSCNRCEWNDKNGLTSKRLKENTNWLRNNSIDEYQNAEYDIIDLRLSNKCNLFCITCSPKSSSSIYDEVKNNLEHQDHYVNYFKNVSKFNLTAPYSDKDVNDLVEKISPNSRVYFTGGEPSLIKPSFAILEKLIDKGYNKTIRLDFNSNFQAFNYKWIEILKQFKGLMMASIDAIGPQAEYIRYGSIWTDIDQNLRRFIAECPNFEIHICPTVSILNIFYLKDIIDWSSTLGTAVQINLTNRLYDPKYYDIRNLPVDLKVKAVNYLNSIDHKHVKEIVEHVTLLGDRSLWPKFIENINKVDKIRNTDWKVALNELVNGG